MLKAKALISQALEANQDSSALICKATEVMRDSHLHVGLLVNYSSHLRLLQYGGDDSITLEGFKNLVESLGLPMKEKDQKRVFEYLEEQAGGPKELGATNIFVLLTSPEVRGPSPTPGQVAGTVIDLPSYPPPSLPSCAYAAPMQRSRRLLPRPTRPLPGPLPRPPPRPLPRWTVPRPVGSIPRQVRPPPPPGTAPSLTL